jgi:hypothetical protein
VQRKQAGQTYYLWSHERLGNDPARGRQKGVSHSTHPFFWQRIRHAKKKEKSRAEQTLPCDVAATVVDGLGDEPHQPDAAAAVHQVDAARHLATQNYYCKHRSTITERFKLWLVAQK